MIDPLETIQAIRQTKHAVAKIESRCRRECRRPFEFEIRTAQPGRSAGKILGEAILRVCHRRGLLPPEFIL